MGILKTLSARNFKCFRELPEISLEQGNYFIGPNNAGKTAALQAINCFFDDAAYSPSCLNKQEFSRRQAGFNRSEISIKFDVNLVTGKARKQRLQRDFGDELEVTKIFTWREQSNSTAITYEIGGSSSTLDELDSDVRHLLSCISISYIHPQEGEELLKKAQEKFKKRLFHNWGRHASVGQSLEDVREKWQALRALANSYLSKTLTDQLRTIWPASEVKIDLPDRLEDIVAISDISFRSSPTLPEISLTDHGTGAQSAILYQTHYVLDSDRSLHKGMHFPVWLLEEPESFLHADIALQLGQLLASPEWQSNIQMAISTHSPLILAGSHREPEKKRWIIFEDHKPKIEKLVSDVDDADISGAGKLMGDPNFDVYFSASTESDLLYIEDSRRQTFDAYLRSGINVHKALNGITEVKKYITVFSASENAMRKKATFIIDSDKGFDELSSLLAGTRQSAIGGWRKYKLSSAVSVIALPEGKAAEDLFSEWPAIVDECLDEILESDLSLKPSIPTNLSRTVDVFRRNRPKNREEARNQIRNHQDIKDRLWRRVNAEEIKMSSPNIEALKEILSTN